MKGLKRFLLLALSLMLILSLGLGCSANKSASDEALREELGLNMGSSMDQMVEESAPSEIEPDKVITTVSLYFETTEFENTRKDLNDIIQKHKSYIENSNISHNRRYNNKSYRYGSFTIRVPRDSVAAFKADLNGIGNLTSENTSKEDVTKQYRDTESRLKVLTTKEERILALLEKAEKIEDIIALENQLSETIAEKESLKTSLINIDDKVDFSTLYIEIQEVEKLSDKETLETGFGTRIKNAFANSLFRFGKSLENLVIASIYFLPFGLILALLIFVAYKIYSKVLNKKDKS